MLKKNKKRQQEEEQKAEENGEVLAPKVKKSPAELRLKKEFAEIDLPAHATISFPNDKDLMKFNVVIDLQREDCLWKGGKYQFTVTIPFNYPHEAPKCHCDTPIYHPNIDRQGNVCLNILRADWKPVLGINPVILGLIFLFIEPNSEDPLNHEAAEVLRNKPDVFT